MVIHYTAGGAGVTATARHGRRTLASSLPRGYRRPVPDFHHGLLARNSCTLAMNYRALACRHQRGALQLSLVDERCKGGLNFGHLYASTKQRYYVFRSQGWIVELLEYGLYFFPQGDWLGLDRGRDIQLLRVESAPKYFTHGLVAYQARYIVVHTETSLRLWVFSQESSEQVKGPEPLKAYE